MTNKRPIPLILVAVLSGMTCELVAQDADSIATRFKQLDKNSDGRLSTEEFDRRLLFRRLDINQDGFVTLAEAQTLRTMRGQESSMTVRRDVVYGKHERHRLDIYAPKNAKSAPVMIYVHGGGWRIGDKSRVGLKADFFTKRGWIFVSTNYRLFPEGKHPRNVEDIATAIAWVHDRVKDYGGVPDKIAIMGHSAGCHLVSLVATDGRHLKKAGKPLAVVKGVIALDTQAYDVPTLMSGSSVSQLYKTVFSEDKTKQQDASPVTHVSADKDIPPFLICYSRGMRVRTNPQRSQQADAFARALKKAKIRAEVVDASDRDHGAINQRFGDPKDDKVTVRAMTFLRDVVHVQDAP